MDTVVFVLQILMWFLCPAVIGLILLQGAAGDISSSFGGGGQLDASLGVGAHRKMAQVTGVLAVVFFVIVLVLAYPHRRSFQDAKGAPAAVPAAPKLDAPAAPAPETPKAEAPAAPAPAAQPEAPKAEAPAAPAPEAPKAEAPAAPAPAAVPAVQAEAPAAAPAAQPEAPKAEAPAAPAPAPAEAPAKP